MTMREYITIVGIEIFFYCSKKRPWNFWKHSKNIEYYE